MGRYFERTVAQAEASLKRCPFCNGFACIKHEQKEAGPLFSFAECVECGSRGQVRGCPRRAAECWNRRAGHGN